MMASKEDILWLKDNWKQFGKSGKQIAAEIGIKQQTWSAFVTDSIDVDKINFMTAVKLSNYAITQQNRLKEHKEEKHVK